MCWRWKFSSWILEWIYGYSRAIHWGGSRRSKNSKLHAAPLTNGSKIGILHGAAQYVIQDKEGQIGSTESISAGLDYPGISPLHCYLKDTKRARYTSASDEEALKAYQLVSKLENISPSLEPSHAFAEVIKIAPKLKSSEVIIVNSCGDSLKDKDIIKQRLGSYKRWNQRLLQHLIIVEKKIDQH